MKAKLTLGCVAALAATVVAQPPVAKPLPSSEAQLRAKAVPPEPSLPPLVIPDSAVIPAKAVELPRAVSTTPAPVPVVEPEAKFNSVSAKLFASKVQPILTNRCADCHALKDHASGFKLRRIDPGINDPQSADENVRAVAKWITPATPHSSPMLVKAVTAHGKMKEPPLPGTHTAYKQLELWVHWACGPEGSGIPREVPPAPAVVAAAPAPEPSPIRQAVATQPVTPLPPAIVTPASHSFAASPPEKKADPTKANPNDPFDPAAFNRFAHPERR